MNYDKKAINQQVQSTIKSLVGLIDAVDSIPLDDDSQSGTFTLDDGTEVMLSHQIKSDVSAMTIALGNRDVKYIVTEERKLD